MTRVSVPVVTHPRKPEIRRLRQPYNNAMYKHMKRTTLLLDAALHADLKRRAASEGRTLTDVVERALRMGLAAMHSPHRGRVSLPSFDLGPFLTDPARRDLRPGAPAGEED